MSVPEIMQSPAYRRIVEVLDAEHDRTVADIITLTEIPAPPFGEAPKAAHYVEMLRAHGLEDVELDGIGNAMGLRRGAGNGRLIVVAAHLDTVFPAGTDVKVKREGTKLYAPGVGDDTRSLAVLLAYIRALEKEHREMRAALEYTADKRFWRYNGHIAAYVWEGETRDGNELAGDIEPFEVCRRVLSSLSHHP